LSFAALVTLVLRRAEHGLNQLKSVSDSKFLQQWTDIFTLLIMVLARIPNGLNNFRPTIANLRAELAPLTMRSRVKGWPISRPRGKFSASMPRRYQGLNLPLDLEP
jgi:hypothetical protein